MTPPKSAYPILAQAETLLIYGIFLLLTGLGQIAVTMGHRYVLAKNRHVDRIELLHLLPMSFDMQDIHLWFIYLSASLTVVPFSCCVFYAICKRQFLAIFICTASLISFISSSVYVGLLIIHTLEYWQTIASPRPKSFLPTTTSTMQLLVPFDEPATFVNLALLITFTLALVQALLSLIGAVIACLWSPCCADPVGVHKPVATHSHYAQTTPSRFEGGAHHPPPLRSMRRPQLSETHRYIITNDSPDPVMNGFLQRSPLLRSNYDDV